MVSTFSHSLESSPYYSATLLLSSYVTPTVDSRTTSFLPPTCTSFSQPSPWWYQSFPSGTRQSRHLRRQINPAIRPGRHRSQLANVSIQFFLCRCRQGCQYQWLVARLKRHLWEQYRHSLQRSWLCTRCFARRHSHFGEKFHASDFLAALQYILRVHMACGESELMCWPAVYKEYARNMIRCELRFLTRIRYTSKFRYCDIIAWSLALSETG